MLLSKVARKLSETFGCTELKSIKTAYNQLERYLDTAATEVVPGKCVLSKSFSSCNRNTIDGNKTIYSPLNETKEGRASRRSKAFFLS